MLTLIPLLAALGCNKDEETFESPAQLLEGDDAVTLQLGPAVGVGSVAVPVRPVNTWGIAVPVEGSVTLSDGQGRSASEEIDGLGWAWVEMSGDDEQLALEVSGAPSGMTTGQTGDAWVLGSEPAALALDPAWAMPGEPQHLAGVDEGAVMVLDNQVWWQPPTVGAPAVQVADLDLSIDGLLVDDVDNDGISDLITWTTEAVFLLRGRTGGGFGWATGFNVPGAELRSVGVGLVNEDVNSDLVLAFATGGAGQFQVLLGDGLWGFEEQAPVDLLEEPWSVDIGDYDGDTVGDVAVLHKADSSGLGVIKRYSLASEGWYELAIDMAGGELDRPLDEGSVLFPGFDLSGDGEDEVIALGPWTSGARRTLAWFVVDNGYTQYELAFVGFHMGRGELTGDGYDDLILVEQDPLQLRMISTESDQADFLNRSLAEVPAAGLITTSNLDDDFVPDVLIATNTLTMYAGSRSDTDLYQLLGEGLGRFSLGSEVDAVLEDTSGDGLAEIYVLRESNDELKLQGFQFELDEGAIGMTTPSGFSVGVDDLGGTSASGLDLEHCGSSLYALISDGGTWLFSADIASDGGLDERASAGVSGELLACADDEVVVASSDGSWTRYDRNLAEVGSGTAQSGLVDLVLADVDGAGLASWSCVDTGCGVAAADIDGDGLDEVLRSDGNGTVLISADEEIELPLAGLPSFVDIDQDGDLDLCLTDVQEQSFAVFRTVAGGFAPPVVLHTRQGVAWPPALGDLDGDGLPELIWIGEEGELQHTAGSLDE